MQAIIIIISGYNKVDAIDKFYNIIDKTVRTLLYLKCLGFWGCPKPITHEINIGHFGFIVNYYNMYRCYHMNILIKFFHMTDYIIVIHHFFSCFILIDRYDICDVSYEWWCTNAYSRYLRPASTASARQ